MSDRAVNASGGPADERALRLSALRLIAADPETAARVCLYARLRRDHLPARTGKYLLLAVVLLSLTTGLLAILLEFPVAAALIPVFLAVFVLMNTMLSKERDERR